MRLKKVLLLPVMLLAGTVAMSAPSKEEKKGASSAAIPGPVRAAMKKFKPEAIKAHTRFLSDDLLEGRAPGTRGGELAAAYLAAQFEAMGLEPAGDDGTYFQKVPLLGIDTVADKTSLRLVKGDRTSELTYLEDFVAANESQRENSAINSELIFVGHGVVAPEYDWDDYKGVDVRGKTIVMLVDDPPATQKEPGLFGGKARTYYGRWTYKYEMALKQGAEAAILIHTNDSAGYGWNVVSSSWGRERPYVKLKEGEKALTLTGWFSEKRAADLMAQAGLDLAAQTTNAHTREFRPVSLGTRLTGQIVTRIREINTANVVARVKGSDPSLSGEAIIYSAHYDHLGVGKPDKGDAIYNGAIDNATGCAVLLEQARVWSVTTPGPKRSIIFAAVAAEEGGLRGSEYYAANPIVAPGKTVVALNFDSIEQFGRVKNVTMLGVDRTTFEPVALRVTAAMGIRIDPDQHPEQGSFYRSDHFSLAKVGIPAFSIKPGDEYDGKPEKWGSDRFEDYKKNRYHQPSDEFNAGWDFSEGVQIAQLGFWLGWEAINLKQLPTWKKGDEFLAAREKSQGK